MSLSAAERTEGDSTVGERRSGKVKKKKEKVNDGSMAVRKYAKKNFGRGKGGRLVLTGGTIEYPRQKRFRP